MNLFKVLFNGVCVCAGDHMCVLVTHMCVSVCRSQRSILLYPLITFKLFLRQDFSLNLELHWPSREPLGSTCLHASTIAGA